MEISDRQREIVQAARRSGRVNVEALAIAFAVTPQTIRRDLADLCARGLLARVHGGAVPAHTVSNVGYEERRILAAEEKRLIGAAAARLIPNDCSLFITLGTTTEQVARALFDHRDLAIITNNINIVNLLISSPAKEVIIAGGVVRPLDGGIVGEATVDFIRQFKVDYAVISASAIDPDGSILDYDMREVKVAQAIIANARRTILVADHLKFSRTAPVRIAPVSALYRVVTDQPPPEPFAALCRSHGIAVDIVGSQQETPQSQRHGSAA